MDVVRPFFDAYLKLLGETIYDDQWGFSPERVMNKFLVMSFVTGSASIGAVAMLDGQVNLQNTTPGVVQNGHSNISGTSKAGMFLGNGSLLTNLNGASINSGIITLTGTSSTYMIRGSNNSGDPNATGVIGLANSTTGITYGGWFESKSTSGRALFGYASAPSGPTYGVQGIASSNAARAVFGLASHNTGNTYGGWFQTNSPDGVGTYARNTAGGIGLRAESTGTALQVLGSSTFTGIVGIGTDTPSYMLDVVHGGATGIRARSSSTFSIIDIDAANGDAALRFAKAGVNQWNLRNRPGDDYFEFFELNGGGSRMVIQDGTGNVGIGETANPTYKLDVLHGGASGIRARSDSTFSIIDIDGANGDAALRFAKAGVNQWNTRNNPATDDYQIFELGGGGERLRIENGTGNVVIGANFTATGTITGSAKFFLIDDPRDPYNSTLRHACIESDEYKNVYDGVATTDTQGYATVILPDWFDAINEKFRYQLTVLDEGNDFVLAKVSRKIEGNEFTIRTSKPNIEVSWQVTGVRKDAYVKANPLVVEEPKSKAQKGRLLYDPNAKKPIPTGSAADSVHKQIKLAKPVHSAGGSLGG